MHIDSKSTVSIIQATYKMNDNILESKLELKDLGVIAHNHLTFRSHIAVYRFKGRLARKRGVVFFRGGGRG